MRQFDDAEIRAEMAAALGESGDQFLADFAREFLNCGNVSFLTCSGPSTMSR